MELSYKSIKQKDVISVTDGKNLGKASDISLSFPECNWLGLTVPGCKGFKLTAKKELFIPVENIVRIGEDAILVKCEEEKPHRPHPPMPNPPCPPNPPYPQKPFGDRRDMTEYE